MAEQNEGDVDFYELLGIEITAETKEITKAYRIKALKVHPDKNPSPDAAALFHKLSKAYEVLNDRSQRSEYDKKYRARLDRMKKKKEMDSKRRAAQEELEARENKARKTRTEQSQAMAQYEADLARMRAEGTKRREEDERREAEALKEAMKEEEIPEPDELDYALRLKWKRKTGAWTAEEIETMLDPIGKVDTVAVSDKGKKKVSAIVVFKTVVDAHAVITSKDTHPVLLSFESIDWASGHEPAMVVKMNKDAERKRERQKALEEAKVMAHDLRPTNKTGKPLFASTSKPSLFRNIQVPKSSPSSNTPPIKKDDFDDFEAMVLMSLRQSERDRQLKKKQDTADTNNTSNTSNTNSASDTNDTNDNKD